MNQKKVTGKDLIILSIIPIELLIGVLIKGLPILKNQLFASLIAFSIYFIGFLIAILLKRDLLSNDFKEFKQHFIKNMGISIVGAIFFGVIIFGGRYLLSFGVAESQENPMASISFASGAPIIIAGVVSLFAPFTEEIVFRHELFYLWKETKTLKIVMFFSSSILFGLGHYNTFTNQPILMIPLMVAGAMLAGLYYWQKNIWVNIFAHLIYNAVFSFFPAIILIIIKAIGN